MSGSGSTRAARAALIAAALTALTLAGHAAGQGAFDALGVALVLLLSTGLGLAMGGRRLGFAQVLGALIAGQLLLHAILTFTSAHHAGATPFGTTAMLVGHVTAAVIAATVVVHSDGLIARWASLLAALLGSRPLSPARLALPRQECAVAQDTPVPTRLLHHVVSRRGPPRACFALT